MWALGTAAQIERAREILGSYASQRTAALEPNVLEQRDLSNIVKWLNERRKYAGLKEVDASYFIVTLSLLGLVALCLAFLGSFKFFPIVLLAYVLIEIWRIKKLTFARCQEFEKDYTALLLSLASAVRTGLDPLVALIRSAELFSEKSVVQSELIKTRELINSGSSEDQALEKFASSINHPDIQLFRSAFILARKEGSSLSECLQRLTKVTRQRQSFRRRIRSAVAMQKLSAIGIGACTLAIAAIQAITNPQAFRAALAHDLGFKALVVGLSLVVLGVAWMLSMTRSKL